MIIYTAEDYIPPNNMDDIDFIGMISETIKKPDAKIQTPEEAQAQAQEEYYEILRKAMKMKVVENIKLYLSTNNINKGSILSLSSDFRPHSITPHIHIYDEIVNKEAYILPTITYINNQGSIITLLLRSNKDNDTQVTEIQWKTQIPTNTSRFFGGINHFYMNKQSYTLIMCGNDIIIRNNTTKKETIFKIKFYSRSKPCIKVIDDNKFMIIFQDVKNSVITYTIDMNTNFISFFESKTNIDAVIEINPIILEYNNCIFFNNGNEIKIFYLDDNGTLAEIANTNISNINQEKLATYPFIYDQKIHFWIKSENMLHLKSVCDLSVNNIASFDLSQITNIIQEEINDKSKDFSSFENIKFIDSENFILYNETIAILVTYYQGALYYHKVLQIPQTDKTSEKIKNIFVYKNILACESTKNNTILKNINQLNMPNEKNTIKHDEIESLILNLFPIIIFSNYQYLGVYYHATKELKIEKPNIFAHNPNYIVPIL